MSVFIVDQITSASGPVNEDTSGVGARSAWVVDGATGFSERRLTPGASDAAWYAQRLSEALTRRTADGDLTMTQVLSRAIQDVAVKFSSFAATDVAPEEIPLAALALIRASEGKLEYAVLGDCAVLLRYGGKICIINDPHVATFDRVFGEKIRALHERGITDRQQLLAHMIPEVNRIRRMANQPGGFWIASLDAAAAEHAISGSVPLGGGVSIMLTTDGFLRLIDPFGKYSAGTLMAGARERGLASLLKELRAAEAGDETCLRFPRIKVRDDATAMLLEIR